MKLLMTILAALGLASEAPGYKNVSVEEFAKIISGKGVQILDVRTPDEFIAGHIEGALLADYNGGSFREDALKVLRKGRKVAIYCRSGRRSAAAAQILAKEGFELYNLQTGILGWEKAGRKLSNMKQTDINAALGKEDVINLIGKQWMLVTAGTKDSYNTMTASWGGVGVLWNKPVAFIFIRPERYTHDFIEKSERVTLSFYPEQYRRALQVCGSVSGRDIDKTKETGLVPVELEGGVMTFSQARLTIVGRKLFKAPLKKADFIDKSLLDQWYSGGHGGLHDVYVLEIEKVYE